MEYDIVSEANALPNINTCSWESILEWLKRDFQLNPAESNTFPFSEAKVQKLLEILNDINSKFLWYDCLEEPVRETLTETLKVFRRYVTNQEVVTYLLKESIFHTIFGKLIEYSFTKKNGQELYTKYLLQLFSNLVSVGHDWFRKDNREEIRAYYFGHISQYFINAHGHMVEASGLLYNLLFDIELKDVEFISTIILYQGDPDKTNEFLDYLVENIIASDFFWQTFENFASKTRLVLLSCLRELLINPNPNYLLMRVNHIRLSCLERFMTMFNKSANVIFQVTQPGCINSSQEVSYILEILAHASSNEHYLPHLQKNKDIFINAGVLLLNVHRLGQMSNNIFTPVQKLSQVENDRDEARNPVFGFKADLVRLIGNLCWKNRRMQDLAREAEVIPVLLDCCNIDEKNPFIIQWVILAIRNICENNRENQAVIAGVTRQKVINADVLEQCGLVLHSEDDLTIGLVKIHSKNKDGKNISVWGKILGNGRSDNEETQSLRAPNISKQFPV